MRSTPEDDALRRFRATGAPEELARVFDATALGLTLLAGHLARDAAEAEDLVQQTFLVALRDAERWDGARPVGAWLAGILRHRAQDLARARHMHATEQLGEHTSPAPGPLDAAASRETFERVTDALEHIDGPSRQVLALRLVHGLEPRAIAHALGRPPGTVRMQLQRGLERLRALVPAGTALGALFTLDTRGLAAVRTKVLAEAASRAGVTAPLMTTSGVFFVQKWVLASLAMLLAAFSVHFVLDARAVRTEAPPTPEALAASSRSERVDAATLLDAAPPSASAPRTASVLDVIADPPASSARTTLAEPTGIDVMGRVLDLDRRPVAGAAVVEIVGARPPTLVERTRTDEAGAFVVRGLVEGAQLLARAPGWQPSAPESARGGRELTLVLGAVGHRVQGRVVDDVGRAVPFARLAFGVDEDARELHAGTDRVPSAQPESTKALDLEGILVTADADGRFETREVPAGYVFVVARPPGDSPLVGWTSTFVQFGADARLELVLQHGASITGSLRDARDLPIAGVAIAAEWEGTRELGQFEDTIGPMVSDPTVATDGDGRCVLRGLLPGEYDLRALASGIELVRDEVTLAPGEARAWTPSIPNGSALRLHVASEAGEPLAGWQVTLAGDAARGVDGPRRVVLDEDGRGTLHGLPLAESFALAFDLPDARGRYAAPHEAAHAGVAWSADVVELRVSLVAPPATIVGGRWPVEEVDRDGVRLTLRPVRGRGVDADLSDDGSFVFEGLAPGSYRLMTGYGGGYPSDETLAEVEVVEGRTIDLGTLRLPQYPRLSARVFDSEGRRLDGTRLTLRDARGSAHGRFDAAGATFVSTPVRPGAYLLFAEAPGFALTVHPIEVGTALVQDAHIVVQRGVPVRFELRFAKAEHGVPTRVDLRVLRPDGLKLFEERLGQNARDAPSTAGAHSTDALVLETLLVPGEYSLDARDMGPTRTGRAVQQFTVAGSGERQVVLVELER